MRIIAGTAGGRRLKTLPGLNTRPTADRVKEAIFSVLGTRVLAARALDLFAGSGALALEALSRGADHAVVVEKSTRAAAVIRENAKLTGLTSKVSLLTRDGLIVLRELEGQVFDLIFLDPPYRQGLAQASLEILAEGNYLASNGVIIVETSREEEMPVELGTITLRKQNRYGDTVIWYYQLRETGGREK